jgi:fibronectin-binding autotransporter adhesin
MTTTNSYFRKPLALLVLAALGASMLLLASQAQAASLMVTTEADELNTDGDCSLREAIEAANTNTAVDACVSGSSTETDTIGFAASLSGQTITLASQLPDITAAGGALTIDGGSADITISGNKAVRVFQVNSGANLALENLTVADGKAVSPEPNGGGLRNNGGTVTVTDSTFSGNTVEGTGQASQGGGIRSFGTLTVTNSTFSGNNSSTGQGGGIFITNTVATVTNTTFSGNSAIQGGGIFSDEGTLTVTNTTFSGNSAAAGAGAGIETFFGSFTTITLRNTIVADSTQGDNCDGQITDGGGNLDDGTTCGFTASTSKSNTPAGLDPAGLQDNGGPTQTIALCSGVNTPAGCTGPSAAIDAAVSCPPPATDQRGVSRPQGSACDIGSFELQSTYDFSGFFSPVDNAPANNEVKAGRAIPVKFSLGGDQGLDIFESGYPKSVEMPCESTASVDAIEQTLSGNSSHLTYDATTDTYTYVWKTDKGWAGTCRQLVVKLNDGSTEHVANFTFVK